MKRLLLGSFIIGFSYYATGQCVSAGPRNGNSFSANTSIGTLVWSNLSNAQTSNNAYASASQSLGAFSTVNSQYLVASNFGFTIPNGSSICGIVVEIERNAGGLGIGSSIKDNSLKIVKDGSIGGTEMASSASWGGSDAYSTYGNNLEKWGNSWTESDINASDFGVAISIKISTGIAGLFLMASIDHIRITVYYQTIVPVQLVSFTGKAIAQSVQLQWTTASEVNSKAFIPQRSRNSGDWIELDSIPAAGSSSLERNYSMTDREPENINYYRLKQMDVDGRIEYSKTIRVEKNPGPVKIICIFPNPASNDLRLSFGEPVKKVEFFDLSGHQVSPRLTGSQGGIMNFDFSRLRTGSYWIRAVTNSRVLVERLLIIR